MNSRNIQEMYEIVGVGPFDSGLPRDEQFNQIKRAYRKKALIHHPDKGGNHEQFLILQTAFEYLRDQVYDTNGPQIHDFTTQREDFGTTYEEVKKRDVPSWEYYKEAPDEDVPMYVFEYATSNRSSCVSCKTQIPKGEVRVGKLNMEYGTYGKFAKLPCFSWDVLIPHLKIDKKTQKKVLDRLEYLDGFFIRGFSRLKTADKKRVAAYVLTALKSKKRTRASETEVLTKKLRTRDTIVETSNTVVVPEDKPIFIIPKRTKKNKNKLKDQIFVSTGTFPELGGGTMKKLGKEKLREIIELFGGSYRDKLSKNSTTYLIVGKNQGDSKSQKAYKWKIPKMSLHELKLYIESDNKNICSQ